MTDAVPAEVALAYLATLSLDLRSALVLDAAGEPLAGDATLTPAALALRDGAREGGARQAPRGDGRLFAVWSASHTLALAVGPQALEALVVHDALTTLDDLRGC